jgi:hypothetical protein
MTLFVKQPDATRVALAFLDHRLRQRTEKAVDVGLAHQQVERELYDIGLHPGEALGAPPFGVLVRQRGAQDIRIAFVRMHGDRLVVLVARGD